MAVASDPRVTLSELHRQTTTDVLRLVEGLYSNIEDGLFELADRGGGHQRRERCFNLMRELRFRRSYLQQNFTKTLHSLRGYWFIDELWEPDFSDLGPEFDKRLELLTAKSAAHFTGLLTLVAERARDAGACQAKAPPQLPLAPLAISQSFVQSCRTLRMDSESIELVLALFARFVLDRLGQVYAGCNEHLRTAGYRTDEERAEAQRMIEAAAELTPA